MAIIVLLISYSILNKKGDIVTNVYFSLLVFVLSIQSVKYFMHVFTQSKHDFTFNLWLFGVICTGPLFYIIADRYVNTVKGFVRKDLLHIIPVAVFVILWLSVNVIRLDYRAWNLFHRSVMLMYILYLSMALFNINRSDSDNTKLKRQLEVIGMILCFLWFSQLLNEVSGLRYLSGTVLFGFMMYMTIRIWYNKGFIIDTTTSKYLKTGLKDNEKERIINELERLIYEDKVFMNNTLSIAKVAKEINTSTHALSQVINENYHHSFFDLISKNRIAEAGKLLKENRESKISDIAYEVGYNSLSAFNTAFKKQTGSTPTQFRNGK